MIRGCKRVSWKFFCHCDVELPGLCRRAELAMWVRPLCLNSFLRQEAGESRRVRAAASCRLPAALPEGKEIVPKVGQSVISSLVFFRCFLCFGVFPPLLCKSLWQLNNRDPELKIMRSTNSLSLNLGCNSCGRRIWGLNQLLWFFFFFVFKWGSSCADAPVGISTAQPFVLKL